MSAQSLPQFSAEWPVGTTVSRVATTGGLVPRGITFFSADPASPEVIAAIEAAEQPIFNEESACVALVRAGKLSEARARLQDDLLKYPNELIALPLLDVDLTQGDYVGAYKVAVPFVRRGRASERLRLRASMAAAGVGEVYPGQRQFLETVLSHQHSTPDDVAALPTGESPQDLLAFSALAISNEYFETGEYAQAVPFTPVFLSWDPANPALGTAAAAEYTFAGQYKKAIAILQGELRKASENPRSTAGRIMWLAKERLKDYGDGNLPPSPWAKKTDTRAIKP